MSHQQRKPPEFTKFIFGGLAGIGATLVVHPTDVVKNRMQMRGEGSKLKKRKKTTIHVTRSIVTNEGIWAIYSGLSAGVFRQATYATTRIGIYTWLSEQATNPSGRPPNFITKILLGMTAGAAGAFVGTPAEVTLIRMTLDGRLPLEERRNYKHVGDALVRIVKDEGISTLWRGVVPTVTRAMVTNAVQLASYFQAKQSLLARGYLNDNIYLHFWSSMISGFATTAASLPVDIAKTRLQNMKIIEGKPEYHGTMDVIGRVIRNEGFLALWKGFTPYYARVGPHTVLTFIFLEQLNNWYKRVFLA